MESKIKYLEDQPKDTNRQKAIYEKLYLGINLTSSACDDYEKEVDSKTCKEAYFLPNKSKFNTYAVIDKINMRKTGEKAKIPGRDYCYLDLSDSSGAIKGAVCWPDLYEEIKDQLAEDIIILISSKKNTYNGRNQVVINKLEIIG